MSMEADNSKGALSNCWALIVEDDVSLASRIAALFCEHSGLEPAIAHYVDQAHQVVANNLKSIDLAIVDVMLPQTREDFEEIQELEIALGRIRRVFAKSNTTALDEDMQPVLIEARYERAQVLKRIQYLINVEGGIELVKEWRKAYPSQDQLFPILYLTAVGKDVLVQRGLSAAGRSSAAWLVKPVPSDLIIEKCVGLLMEKMTKDRS